MMRERFEQTSCGAKFGWLNFSCTVVLAGLFCGWTAAIASWAGTLHTWQGSLGTVSFYYSYYLALGAEYDYAAQGGTAFASSCNSGGQGLVFVAAMCFIAATIAMILRSIHWARRSHIVPYLGLDNTRYLRWELGLVYTAFGFNFLMSVIWGATCYHATANNLPAGYSQSATGYAWIALSNWLFLPALYFEYELYTMPRQSEPNQPQNAAAFSQPQPSSDASSSISVNVQVGDSRGNVSSSVSSIAAPTYVMNQPPPVQPMSTGFMPAKPPVKSILKKPP